MQQFRRFQKASRMLIPPPSPALVSPVVDAKSCHLPIRHSRVLEPSTTRGHGSTLFSPSLSVLAALLTPAAVVAGTLGVWRLGADPGWTSQFFITDGLLSHWQGWFTVAIGAQVSGRRLNRWLKMQDFKVLHR